MSIALEPPLSTLGHALFTGEHLSPLWAFIGYHQAMLIRHNHATEIIIHFYLVYDICNKLGSYDIYAPA
ncbi:hypothetical protein GmHk_19G054799 [Glycine max]|nr:hypothetical protein GmHk_19G054799 [Glycine max]